MAAQLKVPTQSKRDEENVCFTQGKSFSQGNVNLQLKKMSFTVREMLPLIKEITVAVRDWSVFVIKN